MEILSESFVLQVTVKKIINHDIIFFSVALQSASRDS